MRSSLNAFSLRKCSILATTKVSRLQRTSRSSDEGVAKIEHLEQKRGFRDDLISYSVKNFNVSASVLQKNSFFYKR